MIVLLAIWMFGVAAFAVRLSEFDASSLRPVRVAIALVLWPIFAVWFAFAAIAYLPRKERS